MAEPELPPPDYSVLDSHRLVAYVWRRPDGGELRRAGARNESLGAIPFAEVAVFEAKRIELLRETASRSADLDTYLFKLRLEELSVVEGAVEPGSSLRRF